VLNVVYPPAPWRLVGHVVVVAAPVALEAVRSLVPSGLRLAPVLPGRALGIVLIGLYGKGSTLQYAELAGMVAPVLGAGAPAGLVHAMYVDDARSCAGGRELWGVPKELARFRWRPGAVEVTDVGGAPLLRAVWREPRILVPIPAAVPFLGALHRPVRRGRLTGTLRLAPVHVALDVAAGSPLATLTPARARLAAVGRLDVAAQVIGSVPIR
jgi:acetoacetate decarboxylase